MWISDLFMKRVEAQEKWSLMCPHECPGLSDTYGDEFEALYTKYEKEGKYRRIVPAQKLWFAILEAQTETGTPYMLYKDACTRKSNQKVCLSLNPLLNPKPHRSFQVNLKFLVFMLVFYTKRFYEDYHSSRKTLIHGKVLALILRIQISINLFY